MTLFTFGHGTASREEFARLVRSVGIEEIVDIRSFPGSRRNPQFGKDEMAQWLPETGLKYTWFPDLGGRRKPRPDSPHVALRHPAFRAYADHMETDVFLTAIDRLIDATRVRAVMCSESVWWRCHRRLVADHLVLVREIEVTHLMHDGRLTAHPPTSGVRLASKGLVYDVPTD